MSEPFPISPAAESFIESAKILAEPYEEEIAALRAERDRLLALVAAQAEELATLRATDDYQRWARAVAERDAAREQVARVRALCDGTEAQPWANGPTRIVGISDVRAALEGGAAT